MVDLSVRFVAPEYVPVSSTARIDVIVDTNAYDSAEEVTLTVQVNNANATSSDPAWRCTSGPEQLQCTAAELAAGPHPVRLDVAVPASVSNISIRASVAARDGFDPRGDNNEATVTSRVFDPARCQASAPRITGDLQWAPVAGASSYDIFLGADGETPHVVSTLDAPGGDIVWFVRARFVGCPSLDSAAGKFHSANAPSTLAVTTAASDGLIAPRSVAVDGTTVYVTDPPAKTTYMFDSAAQTLAPMPLFGDVVTSPPAFDGGITAGPGQMLYDADRGTNSVRFRDSTRYMYFAAGQPSSAGTVDGQGGFAKFDAPAAVAITPAGFLYVTDDRSNVVRRLKYDSSIFDFEVITFASGFNGPAGIAVDAAGNVFVADRGNHVIRKIEPGGTVSVFAGLPAIAGHRDGNAGSALFNRPYGIAIDAYGNIYVSEEGNHDMRKIAPNGRVSTVASGGGLMTPALFAIAADGTFWIPDEGNGRLLRAVISTGARRRAVHR